MLFKRSTDSCSHLTPPAGDVPARREKDGCVECHDRLPCVDVSELFLGQRVGGLGSPEGGGNRVGQLFKPGTQRVIKRTGDASHNGFRAIWRCPDTRAARTEL